MRTTFLTGTAPAASSRQSRTAMRGFKDDFYAWKDSLSKDEQALILKQAQNEFDKKFRKSDTFSQDLPEEKIQSFAKVLKKFFDNEKDDYKKDAEQRTPDYDALKNKAALVSYDFGLKRRVVEIDRDADRRWMYASMKARVAEAEDKEVSDSAPFEDAYKFSKDTAEKVHDFISKANSASSAPKELKGEIDKMLKENPPSDDFKVRFPRVLHERLAQKALALAQEIEDYKANHSEAEVKEFNTRTAPEEFLKTATDLIGPYYEAREANEKKVEDLKAFFRSQKKVAGKTKADIVKEIFKVMPKYSDTPMPPLDEEMLADLAKIPAVLEGEFKHNWGTAEKLYKSEAIDSFGNKYLLGVFETVKEAEKAFDEWNKEYEQAGVDVQESLSGWAKQQEAALAEDQDEVDRLRKQLEEARR
ncbi:tdp2 [Symbiodinium natans]|uniref:Tdp2 protein n=1 Tax=Symbiodinium natans TaxID=878477 RepID=A0A812NU17_9DINO|nr:tdp2 [Symbiodinium natans]